MAGKSRLEDQRRDLNTDPAFGDVAPAAKLARVQMRMRQLEALSVALAEATSLDQVATAAVTQSLRAMGASVGLLAVLTPDELEMELVASTGVPLTSRDGWRRFPTDSGSPLARAVRERRPVFVESLGQARAIDHAVALDLERLGAQALAAVPVRANGHVSAAMALAFQEQRVFDEDDRSFIAAIAAQCAQALERGRLYEAAISANNVKADFLAMMSHELRTPLTAILGYTDLLENEIVGPISELQRDHLQRVRTSGEHLLILIQDLLSFSRLEGGRENVLSEPFQVADVVEAAISMVRPLAERKGLALMSVMPDETVIMNTDAGKVRQILVNLFANAIKFTDRGGVALNVLNRIRYVEFRVTDTGIGISSAHLDRIFDAFWQVDQSTTRCAGGAGLGLSIAKQLARLLGGDVRVVSESGAGSIFTAIIPLHAPGESAEPA